MLCRSTSRYSCLPGHCAGTRAATCCSSSSAVSESGTSARRQGAAVAAAPAAALIRVVAQPRQLPVLNHTSLWWLHGVCQDLASSWMWRLALHTAQPYCSRREAQVTRKQALACCYSRTIQKLDKEEAGVAVTACHAGVPSLGLRLGIVVLLGTERSRALHNSTPKC
jgi:hypothetical protein